MTFSLWNWLNPKKKGRKKKQAPLADRLTEEAEYLNTEMEMAWGMLKSKLFGTEMKIPCSPMATKERHEGMAIKYPIKPYPFQLEGVYRIEEFGYRSLLADEPGLGKTIQALLCAYRNPKLFPMIVICPASAKWTWQRECTKMGFDSDVLESTSPGKGKLPTRKDIAIINYDILEHWMDKLKSYSPNFIVPDEVHYAGNIEAKRTQIVMELCRGVNNILGMSGTPMLSRPIQLFPIAHILRPDKFPSIMSYAAKYCQPQIKYGKWDFGGVRKLKMGVLNRRITKYFMIRRKKTDVLDDLPPVTHTVVPLNLPAAAIREYQTAMLDFRGWLRGHSPGNLAGSLRSEALVKIGYMKRLAAKLKMPQVISWTDDFLQSGEKLIQFGITVDLVKEMASRFSPGSVIVNGSVTGKKRQEAIDRFNSNEDCNLFAANIDAAGTNWSCRSASNTCCFELAWNPGIHNQAWQRCHGIGRGEEGKGVNSYYLVARNTLEERLCELLQEKQTNINSIIDGNADAIDFSIMDRLMEAIRKGECE